jgi:hypothetical protein
MLALRQAQALALKVGSVAKALGEGEGESVEEALE